jgi:AbiV family abortive infection protein
MPKLPTDPQEMEQTVVGLAAAAFDNARMMHRSAQVLLEQGLWAPAFSWAALATEEVGKAVICIGLLTTPRAIQGPAVDEFHKAFNHHVTKAGFAHFVLAISAEQMPASWERMLQEVAEAARQTHLMKMRGLYVDYDDNGTLLEPKDVGEDAARFMVATVTRLLEQSAPAEASVTEDPDAYLYFVREWQDGIDYESLQARVDEDPMAFLAEVRGFARDELPPSPAILGERLAEQIAAASRNELSAGEPVRPALD